MPTAAWCVWSQRTRFDARTRPSIRQTPLRPLFTVFDRIDHALDQYRRPRFARRSGLLRGLLPARKPSPWSVSNDSPPKTARPRSAQALATACPVTPRPARRIERGVVEQSIAGV